VQKSRLSVPVVRPGVPLNWAPHWGCQRAIAIEPSRRPQCREQEYRYGDSTLSFPRKEKAGLGCPRVGRWVGSLAPRACSDGDFTKLFLITLLPDIVQGARAMAVSVDATVPPGLDR